MNPGSESEGVSNEELESPLWEGTKAFVGSLWDNLKRWDNDEVAENYNNLRENGSGPITAAAAAFGASVGERAGAGMLEDARSGVSADGERLGTGSRIWRSTLGLGFLTLEALGLKGSPKAAKQALNKADDLLQSIRTRIDDLFGNKADDVVTDFPTPVQAMVPKGAKPLGDWGEARLKHLLNGQGAKTNFSTTLGRREIDRLIDGIAHESKAGVNVKLTSRIRQQVLKDKELIDDNIIRGSHWHFWQGADQGLLDFLTEHGIDFTVHK